MKAIRYALWLLMAIPVILIMALAQWLWGDDKGEP